MRLPNQIEAIHREPAREARAQGGAQPAGARADCYLRCNMALGSGVSGDLCRMTCDTL